ncbi:MAG TPA: DUF89 family protein [Planctomycetes bacterium]|nr:DUF89 family protein [Planctomycetota bacterium]
MRSYLDCIPCFVRQALEAARLVACDEKTSEKVVRRVLALAAEMDLNQSPPVMGGKIHRVIRQVTGKDDPYKKIKQKFNALALRMYPEMKGLVAGSPKPLETAVRLAIAGNIIDFGVSSSLKTAEVEQTIEDSLKTDFDMSEFEEFSAAVKKARKILYLCDNAGEIVFDRLLIEQLPYEKITCVVKGSPVINDATMEDAVITGLTEVVKVIENGSDDPGTVLKACSEDFRRRFDRADLVIAKGQGNYETLSDADKNIFFILKAKCPVIARHLGCQVGTMILSKSRAFKKAVG